MGVLEDLLGASSVSNATQSATLFEIVQTLGNRDVRNAAELITLVIIVIFDQKQGKERDTASILGCCLSPG
jgi:hypothetical protein